MGDAQGLTIIKVSIGNKLYTAPIKSPGRVLDIGTGTGIWAMEMGESEHTNLC